MGLGFGCQHKLPFIGREPAVFGSDTHIWQATVCAHADLRFIGVYEDSWMPQWPTASVTGHDLGVGPSNRLFMDEVNCGERLGLKAYFKH